MKLFIRNIFGLVSVMCVDLTSFAAGARDIIVASPFDGQAPYMIVVAEEGFNSPHAPGVYAANREGQYKLLVAGKVLKNGGSLGIVAHLNLTKHSERHEALVVVNGQLFLIQQHNSTAFKRAHSLIQIGGSDFQISDPLTNEIVHLPVIGSLEDIQVFTYDSGVNSEVVLISLRNRLIPGPLVQGVTFAFNLTAKKKARSWAETQTSQPYLLDNLFRTKAHLRALSSEGFDSYHSGNVISTRALVRFTKATPGEPEFLAKWRVMVAGVSEKVKLGEVINDPYLIRLDLTDGQLDTTSEISGLTELNKSLAIEQYYDPVTNRSEIYFKDFKNFDGTTQSMPGLVAASSSSKSGYHFYEAINKFDKQHAAVAVVDGSLYYLVADGLSESQGSNISIIKLSMKLSSVDAKIKFRVFATPIEGDKSHLIYIVVSTKNEGTCAFVIKKSLGYTEFKKKIQLSDTFLNNYEISWRGRFDKLRAGSHFLFDAKTESGNENRSSYLQKVDPQELVTDVTSSGPGLLNKIFPVPLETHAVTDNYSYMTFKKEGEKITNGMLVELVDGLVQNDTQGQLLPKVTKHGAVEKTWDKRVFEVNHQFVNVTVMALDAAYKDGVSGFTTQTIVEFQRPQMAGKKQLAQSYRFSTNLSANIKFVDNIFVVKGKKNSTAAQIFFILNDPTYKASVYTQTIKFLQGAEAADHDSAIELSRVTKLAEPNLDISDIKDRLRCSKSGDLYWVTDPELPETNDHFSVKNLITGDLTRVNTHKGKKLELLRLAQLKEDELNKDDYELGYAGEAANWLEHGTYAVRDYFIERGYGDALKQSTKDESEDKLLANIEASFPGLGAKLDALVHPNKPPQHLILLTSDEEKTSLLKAVIDLGGSRRLKYWNTSYSSNMRLYLMNEKHSLQEDFLGNLTHISQSNKISVLLADAKDAVNIGSPGSESEEQKNSEKAMVLESMQNPGRMIFPHSLYLLGLEGEKVELKALDKPKKLPRVRSVMVASFSEIQKLEKQLREVEQEGVLQRFNVDTDYLSLDWRLWPTRSSKSDPVIAALVGSSTSGVEEKVVPSLIKKLESMADPQVDPKHTVLIVPEELKDFVRKTILSTWVNTRNEQGSHGWSQHNEGLRVHSFQTLKDGHQMGQRKILEELQAAAEQQRPVILIDGSLLLGKGDRPLRAAKTSTENTDEADEVFTIHDPAMGSQDQHGQAPHLLYLIANEGKKVDLTDFKSHDLKKKTSVLIFATQQEWSTIKINTNFEQRFGLLNHFEMMTLDPPSIAAKVVIAENLFDKQEFRSLDFRFEFDELRFDKVDDPQSNSEKKRKLLTYLVSRVDTLAKQYNREPINSYLGALGHLNRIAVEDASVRNGKVISKNIVEKALSKTFGIPLNLNILAPDDPLVKLSDEEKAAFGLTQVGWEGSLEIKLKYIRAMISQTRSSGDVRNLPSSVVIYGDSSTGKTFLFKSLIKWLGVKTYVFSGTPDVNEESEAIIIDFKTLRTGETNVLASANNARSYTADEMIRHLELFLSGPRGYRGYILLDDVHKAPPKERWKVLSWAQSLFDAPNGIISVTDSRGLKQEISVKNLNLQMIVNPPDDPVEIAKLGPNPTVEQLIVLNIKNAECPFEISALKRWTSIINLSRFPASAKAPALRDQFLKAAKDEFNIANHLLLLSPFAIRDLTKKFEGANAREFLGEAAARLLAIGSTRKRAGNSRSAVDIILPRRLTGAQQRTEFGDLEKLDEMKGSERDTDRLARYINENMVLVNISSDSFEGKPAFLAFLLEAFRISMHEGIIKSVTSDQRFVFKTTALLAPFLHAATTNIIKQPVIPLVELRLDPIEFNTGDSPTRAQMFRRIVSKLDGDSREFFPIHFSDSTTDSNFYRSFIDHTFTDIPLRNTADILREITSKAENILKRLLLSQMRLDQFEALPTAQQWFTEMSKVKGTAAELNATGELVDLYFEFIDQISREHQVGTSPNKSPSIYDMARIFFIVLDKATTSLPWGKTTNFLIQNIESAARQADLGQLSTAQDFLFDAKSSLVNPSVHEAVLQLAAGSDAYRQMRKEVTEANEARFESSCSSFFTP